LAAAGAEIIDPPCNLGVAEAFNICALESALRGRKRLLLLDQDSEIPNEFIGALAARMDALIEAGAAPAVIGPRIVSPPNSRYKAPRYFRRKGVRSIAAADPVQYVISSGSLIDLARFRRVGPFRSDFFIDAIDTEWCFRAWRKGASCWAARDLDMVHRIGQGAHRAIGPSIPRQPDFRLYAFARNQAYCLTQPAMPPLWKARFALHIVRVVLISWAARGFRWRFLALMAQAIRRGWSGKLGPPPGAEAAADLDL
jgi:rhamnosyltransferase